MISYEQARADHEYLWQTYAFADDMTGGYVDQKDLWALLKSPTKQTARKLYVQQIQYWLQVGPDPHLTKYNNSWTTDPKVSAIAKRYDCVESYGRLVADKQERTTDGDAP